MARGVSEILESAIHRSGQEILQRTSGGAAIEFQSTAEVLVEILLDRRAVIVGAELYVVLINLPGEIVEHLVIAVDTMTRNAARCSELSKAAHQNDRQSRIRRAGSGVQPNRAGMEALVGREESFAEAIPAITKFVDLVRSDRMHVRKRDQLHPSRSVSVEARQLAPSRS